MDKPITGGCLCGAVTYVCAAPPMVAGHCQCEDCRRSSGTGHASHMAVPQAAVTVTGEVRVFDKPADSGNMVSRAFCPNCGSPVFSRNSGFTDLLFLRASSLDDPSVFAPQMVVYTSRAPTWDLMDSSLPAFPENPPEVEKVIHGA